MNPSFPTLRAPFGVLSLALGLAMPAQAQRIVGAITDRTTNGEVSSAVVSLLDATGKSTLRAISDAHGKYDVPWPANTRGLQVIRIGFRPVTVTLPVTPHDTTINITMDRLPTLLDTMVVAGKQLCGDSPARRDAARLWDQARAALLGTIVARETKKATSVMLGFVRMTTINGVIVSHKEMLLSGSSSTQYASGRTADEFAARGYRMSTSVGDTYFGPDADVLFDDSFILWHCFATTRDASKRPGLVGLTFEPRRDKSRDALVEIQGTLWIDPAAAALVELEFKFTNVERAPSGPQPGGVVHFRTMPNGVIFIDDWTLLNAYNTGAGVVFSYGESGGEVLQSDWPDGTHYRAPVTEIRGVVRERGTGAPIPGAVVLRAGVAESVRTDSTGEYVFAPIAPGRYDVRVIDTTLDVIRDARTDHAAVEVSRGAARLADFQLEPRQAILDGVCKGQRKPSTVSIAGRIDDRSGAWPEGLRVSLARRAVIGVDDRGRFEVCGVAPDIATPMRLVTASMTVLGDTTVAVDKRPVQVVHWRLPDGSLYDFMHDRLRDLVGRVERADSTPVAGAIVWAVNGGSRTTTDADGFYMLKSLRETPQVLRIDAPGFASLIDTVTASLTRDAATRKSHVIRLKPADPAATSWRTGFDERTQTLTGTAANEAILKPFVSWSVPALLASSSFGLRVFGQNAVRFVASANEGLDRVIGGRITYCHVGVVIDGVVVYGGGQDAQPPDLARLRVADVAAVEVYDHGTPIPARFQTAAGTACGTVLLWLRAG